MFFICPNIKIQNKNNDKLRKIKRRRIAKIQLNSQYPLKLQLIFNYPWPTYIIHTHGIYFINLQNLIFQKIKL